MSVGALYALAAMTAKFEKRANIIKMWDAGEYVKRKADTTQEEPKKVVNTVQSDRAKKLLFRMENRLENGLLTRKRDYKRLTELRKVANNGK